MTRLILSIYIGIALVCAFVIYVELSIITSNTCMRYFIAMYDGKVVDEKLGTMPEDVKEAFNNLKEEEKTSENKSKLMYSVFKVLDCHFVI